MTSRAQVADCRLVQPQRHDDGRGSLTVLDGLAHLPFDVRRAFVIADVPVGCSRGEHANTVTAELIVCVSGSLSVHVEDERTARTIPLIARGGALIVPATLWVELRDFAPGTVVMVLADTEYAEARHGYIRDHAQWLEWRRVNRAA